jgi:hypothetical protein
MKTIKVTRAQYKALQQLSRKDINTIRKHPQLVGAARDLLKACRKVIKRVETLSEYASRRKRHTAYKKIIAVCARAIQRAG